jgi:hypothetical protein
MSYENELYWAVRAAQSDGTRVEQFFEEVRRTWQYVRSEMVDSENRKLAELAKQTK